MSVLDPCDGICLCSPQYPCFGTLASQGLLWSPTPISASSELPHPRTILSAKLSDPQKMSEIPHRREACEYPFLLQSTPRLPWTGMGDGRSLQRHYLKGLVLILRSCSPIGSESVSKESLGQLLGERYRQDYQVPEERQGDAREEMRNRRTQEPCGVSGGAGRWSTTSGWSGIFGRG